MLLKLVLVFIPVVRLNASICPDLCRVLIGRVNICWTVDEPRLFHVGGLLGLVRDSLPSSLGSFLLYAPESLLPRRVVVCHVTEITKCVDRNLLPFPLSLECTGA